MAQSSCSQGRLARKTSISPTISRILFSFVLTFVISSPHLAVHGIGAQRGRPKLQTGDLYALVVGISEFRDPRIPGLSLAAKDARSFGTFLENQKKVFKDIRVTYLIDERATKTAVEKHLYYTLPKAGKQDTIILFFSGHGTYDPMRPKEFLFLAYDSEPDFLSATAVKMSGLEFLKGIEADRVLIIADACHAGGFTQMRHKAAPQSLELFLKEVRNSSGKAVITSGKEEQLSWEVPTLQHSVFTHNLIQGLKGDADTDHDGVVTLTEVYRYAYARTKDHTSGHQHPQFEGKVVGAFPLSYVGPPVPPAQLRERLFDAARSANVEEVKRLIRSGTAIDARDELNNSPLIVSSGNGCREVVKTLLQHSANVDAKNDAGCTALMKACEHGHGQIAGLLLGAGANINARNKEGFGPLALACGNGHGDVAELLLNKGADIRERTNNGQTALYLAAAHGHSKVVQLLLDRGANPSSRDIVGNTALLAAAVNGLQETVNLLLDRGATIQVIQGGFLETQLMLAVMRGHAARVDQLLGSGANPDSSTASGATPLMLAVGLGHDECTKSLTTRGADGNRALTDGSTPLARAASLGRVRTIKLLLEAGSDPDVQDTQGNTPLIKAAQRDHAPAAKLLIDAGCNVNLKNSGGRTALMIAASDNRPGCVKVLLASGADVDARDRDGDTALIIGSRRGHARVVRLLASKRANLNTKNKRGNTALIEAARNGFGDVVKYLLDRGADPDLMDWEGKTASKVAADRGLKEVAALLEKH